MTAPAATSAEAPATASTKAPAASTEAAPTTDPRGRHLRSRAQLLRGLKPLLRQALIALHLGRPICLRRLSILLRRLVSHLRLTPERHNPGRFSILLRCTIALRLLAAKSLHSRGRAVLLRHGLILS